MNSSGKRAPVIPVPRLWRPLAPRGRRHHVVAELCAPERHAPGGTGIVGRLERQGRREARVQIADVECTLGRFNLGVHADDDIVLYVDLLVGNNNLENAY